MIVIILIPSRLLLIEIRVKTYATGVIGTADPKSARIAGGRDAIPLVAATGVDTGGVSTCGGGAAVFIVCGSRRSMAPKYQTVFSQLLIREHAPGQSNDNELQGAST